MNHCPFPDERAFEIIQEQLQREWSIRRRTELQLFMLELHDFLEDPQIDGRTDDHDSILGLLVGISFGLWRAAFLIPKAKRDWKSIIASAKRFLIEVVDTQTISYSFDVQRRDWTSGFYVNDARYRISRLLGKLERLCGEDRVANLPSFQEFIEHVDKHGAVDGVSIDAKWDKCFAALRDGFHLVRNTLTTQCTIKTGKLSP